MISDPMEAMERVSRDHWHNRRLEQLRTECKELAEHADRLVGECRWLLAQLEGEK